MGKHRDRQGKRKHAFNFSKTCMYEQAGAGVNNLPCISSRRSGPSDLCFYLPPHPTDNVTDLHVPISSLRYIHFNYRDVPASVFPPNISELLMLAQLSK